MRAHGCAGVDPFTRSRAGPLLRPSALVEAGRSMERGIPVFVWGVTWRLLAQQACLHLHFASPSTREASALGASNGCRRQLRDWRDRPPQRARLGQRLAVADGPSSCAPSAPSADRCRLRGCCAGLAEAAAHSSRAASRAVRTQVSMPETSTKWKVLEHGRAARTLPCVLPCDAVRVTPALYTCASQHRG